MPVPDPLVLVPETGAGLPTANSYVSLEEADAYLTNSLSSARWNALLEDDKTRFLIAATRWLDQQAKWNGLPTVVGQGLRWPRSGVFDRDCLPVNQNSVPTQLKEAVCEMAVFFTVPENNPGTFSETFGFSEITVDVITLKFQDGHNANASKFLPGLNTLLSGLGRVQTASGRGFAPIQRV